MYSHTDTAPLEFTAAVSATHGQVRSLLQQLTESHPERSLEALRRTLAKVDTSLDAALHTDGVESLKRRGVEGAMDLTTVLSAHRVAEQSPAAYRASSRIAATLLLLSQLSAGQDDPAHNAPLSLAVHTALQEIAAQRLLLELEVHEEPAVAKARPHVAILAGAA